MLGLYVHKKFQTIEKNNYMRKFRISSRWNSRFLTQPSVNYSHRITTVCAKPLLGYAAFPLKKNYTVDTFDTWTKKFDI
jgi:hypothetical protein